MNRLVTNISAKAIGVFVFLFGLLLLSTSILGVLKVRSDIKFSLDGFAIAAGILFLFFSGFYFMWRGYSILFRKRITFTLLLYLTTIPSFLITLTFAFFIRSLWERPETGYSFLSATVLLFLDMTVFLISFFFISKALMSIFRKRGSRHV